MPTTTTGGYEVSDDPDRVDRDAVWAFLSSRAYWARWRSRDDVDRQLDGAWRVVAAYVAGTGELVGFARALSDGVALAYLADVFVADAHRRRGLGHALVTAMVDDGPGADFRWLLHTADAHEMYAAHGFGPGDATFMERPSRRRIPTDR